MLLFFVDVEESMTKTMSYSCLYSAEGRVSVTSVCLLSCVSSVGLAVFEPSTDGLPDPTSAANEVTTPHVRARQRARNSTFRRLNGLVAIVRIAVLRFRSVVVHYVIFKYGIV